MSYYDIVCQILGKGSWQRVGPLLILFGFESKVVHYKRHYTVFHGKWGMNTSKLVLVFYVIPTLLPKLPRGFC